MDVIAGTPDYNPPRFWWTKRIALGSIALVLLIIGLLTTATIVAQHRLNALIESYRAAGEPVYVEDFNVFKDIPDEQNAATYYKQAEQAYVWPKGIDAEIDLDDIFNSVERGEGRAFSTEVDLLLSSNVATLELLKRGSRCTTGEWRMPISSPLIDMWSVGLGPRRSVVRLLGIAAHRSHDLENDRRSIELLIIQLRFVSQIGFGPLGVFPHIVAVASSEAACKSVERQASTLQVAMDGDPDASLEAPVSQVRKLINELLDESAQRSSLKIALAMENATEVDTVKIWCGEIPSGPQSAVQPMPYAFALRPVWISDCCRSLEHRTRLHAAYLETTYPRMKAAHPGEVSIDDEVSIILHPGILFAPALSRVALREFRMRSMRRMAAVALAIRLFEVDHGNRPPSLDALVPGYLDAIPRDPFAHGDKSIQYLPDASPPVLYSVGPDGVDDGGRLALRESGYVDWEKLDLVFFLNGDRPQAKD